MTMLHKAFAADQVRQVEDEERTLEAVVSTGAVDREGDRLLPEGADLSAYRSNPVLMWAHDNRQPPIGKAEWIRRAGNGIRARFRFASHPFAETVWTLYRDRDMRGFSVGFLPRERTRNSFGGFDFEEWELLEVSAVAVGANPEALAASKALERAWSLGRDRSPRPESDGLAELDLALRDAADARWFDEALAAADPLDQLLALPREKQRRIARAALRPAVQRAVDRKVTAATGRLPG